jgi:hypothetical protein
MKYNKIRILFHALEREEKRVKVSITKLYPALDTIPFEAGNLELVRS